MARHTQANQRKSNYMYASLSHRLLSFLMCMYMYMYIYMYSMLYGVCIVY